jgi:hypothetical protein
VALTERTTSLSNFVTICVRPNSRSSEFEDYMFELERFEDFFLPKFRTKFELHLYLVAMLAACILLSLIVGAVALPDGAPVCVIGNPNVNNRHLLVERKPKTGTITAGGFDVFINDELIRFIPGNKNVFGFLAGENNTITIKSTTGQQFRGVWPSCHSTAPLKPTRRPPFSQLVTTNSPWAAKSCPTKVSPTRKTHGRKSSP